MFEGLAIMQYLEREELDDIGESIAYTLTEPDIHEGTLGVL
jgi:hypothetical protein